MNLLNVCPQHHLASFYPSLASLFLLCSIKKAWRVQKGINKSIDKLQIASGYDAKVDKGMPWILLIYVSNVFVMWFVTQLF